MPCGVPPAVEPLTDALSCTVDPIAADVMIPWAALWTSVDVVDVERAAYYPQDDRYGSYGTAGDEDVRGTVRRVDRENRTVTLERVQYYDRSLSRSDSDRSAGNSRSTAGNCSNRL